jgi:L-arabinose isomerase
MIDDDEAGIFVDHLYFGGITTSEDHADKIIRALTNDRSLPGAVVPRKYKSASKDISNIIEKARKQFKQFSKDIYDMEDMQSRMKQRK